VSAARYVPERGDLLWLTFDPPNRPDAALRSCYLPQRTKQMPATFLVKSEVFRKSVCSDDGPEERVCRQFCHKSATNFLTD